MDKCNGSSDLYGKDCETCSRFQDDCDGASTWGWDDNGVWIKLPEVS